VLQARYVDPPLLLLLLHTHHTHSIMILQIAGAVVALVLWFVVLRPRTGGKDAPPTVQTSSVVPIPIVGVLIEFFKSPNTMVQRCLSDYGPVFTIPVSILVELLRSLLLLLPLLLLLRVAAVKEAANTAESGLFEWFALFTESFLVEELISQIFPIH
jgi:hypothetical protein